MQLTVTASDHRRSADKGEQTPASPVMLLDALDILDISLDQFDNSGEHLLSGFFQSLCSLLQSVEQHKGLPEEPDQAPGEPARREVLSESTQQRRHPEEPPSQEPVDQPKGTTELQKNIQILRTNLQSSWKNLQGSPGTHRAATGIYSAVAEMYRAAIGANRAATEIYKAAAEMYGGQTGLSGASAGEGVNILLENVE